MSWQGEPTTIPAYSLKGGTDSDLHGIQGRPHWATSVPSSKNPPRDAATPSLQNTSLWKWYEQSRSALSEKGPRILSSCSPRSVVLSTDIGSFFASLLLSWAHVCRLNPLEEKVTLLWGMHIRRGSSFTSFPGDQGNGQTDCSQGHVLSSRRTGSKIHILNKSFMFSLSFFPLLYNFLLYFSSPLMILRIWQTPKFTVSKFGGPGNSLLRFGDFSYSDHYLEPNVSCAYPLTKVNSLSDLHQGFVSYLTAIFTKKLKQLFSLFKRVTT